MGLWGSFGSGFQRENLIPNIPTIPKTTPEAECEACSRDFRDFRCKVSILKNTSQNEETEPGEGGPVAGGFCELPRRCGGCPFWRHKAGFAWWCGRCAMDGEAAAWKSGCRGKTA